MRPSFRSTLACAALATPFAALVLARALRLRSDLDIDFDPFEIDAQLLDRNDDPDDDPAASFRAEQAR